MYLVYLPDVGRPSEPLIQKHVGRGSSCVSDDEEEDQSRNPRRRRAYNGIAGPEHLEVRHDRRVGQRRVELAALVPRFDEVFCVVGVPAEVRQVFTRRPHAVEDRSRGHVSGRYVLAAAATSSRRARGICPLQWSRRILRSSSCSWRILRSSPTVNSSRDANLSKKLAVAPTSRIMRAPFRVLGSIIVAHLLIRRETKTVAASSGRV